LSPAFLSTGSLLRRTVVTLMVSVKAWSDDRAIRLGAALAYYSLFALIPILLLSVSFAGIFFGKDAAGSAVEEGIADAVGSDIAGQLVSAMDALSAEKSGSLLPLISFGVLIFTATALFVAWNDVVNIIWDKPKEEGVQGTLRRRVFGLAAVTGVGLLLAVLIFAETVLATLDRLIGSAVLDLALKITGSFVPALLGAVSLMVLFKFTPNTRVAWRSVWFAAAVTMVLLSVGAWAYGIYLGTIGVASASGVAGAAFIGLTLIYYSAQILLYGVEISKVVHNRTLDAATDV